MILYKNDPELSLKVITTIQGKKEYRRNCCFIDNKYYLKNEDVFLVNNQWYRVETGKIVYDHEQKEWILKNKNPLINGIVDFKNNEAVIGYYTANYFKNCRVNHEKYGTIACIDVALVQDEGWFEDISSNIWYRVTAVSKESRQKMQSIRTAERGFTNRGYNIEENAGDFENKKKSYKEFSTVISKEVRRYAKFLGDITYGGEFEAIMGNVNDITQHKHGVVICRDGSLAGGAGPEVVTVPMEGAKGVQNIINLCYELQKTVSIDINCSLHYHFGNIPLNREFIVALYVLSYKIQNDIFQMFPFYKTDPRGVKQKNYCQKLKKMAIHPCKDCTKEAYDEFIKDGFLKIFTFLSDGHPPSDDVNVKIHQHPIQLKWMRTKSR